LRPTTVLKKEEIGRLARALCQLGYQLQRASRISGNRAIVVSQHALSVTIGPDIISRTHAEHAQLFVSLRSANAEDCLNLLLTRQADIALVYAGPSNEEGPDPPYLQRIVIGWDDLVPVAAPSHGQRYTDLARAGELSIIAYPDHVFLGTVMDSKAKIWRLSYLPTLVPARKLKRKTIPQNSPIFGDQGTQW
jgi:DNA-binding transcriptional LysR family regulator